MGNACMGSGGVEERGERREERMGEKGRGKRGRENKGLAGRSSGDTAVNCKARTLREITRPTVSSNNGPELHVFLA
jgi:hypothetical protein